MLTVTGLVFHYPKTNFCLKVASFKAEAGQKQALIGPSGCGKTSFLYLLAGIHPLQKGEIQIAGQAIHKLKDKEKRLFRISTIGFVFQDFGLIEYLNVEDNILHP